MARLIGTPTGGGGNDGGSGVGPFEPKVLAALRDGLPSSYAVAPNFQLKQQGRSALEYDFVILAPHALFVVEAKEWYGRLTGDDTEWLINQTPRKCPMWLVDLKCKVLKSSLGAVGNQLWIEPLLVFPDGTSNNLGGNWNRNAFSVTGLIHFLLDAQNVPRRSDVSRYHAQIENLLQGTWGARQRGTRRRIGSYEIIEKLYEDAASGEYIGRRALLSEDDTRYRIRTWRFDQSLPPDELAKRKAVITRPTEAVAKVGSHPNLLPILQFDLVEGDNEFFEVTEWSDYGTLHGYLHNRDRDRLTLRERFQIAEGVASALEAVHAHNVVHRNVSPESIVIGFDRRPRLTDFDRAYIEARHTVFAQTERKQNIAFVPPELADKTDYDFDTTSDMYSFGVLLYFLLVGQPPFSGPEAATAAEGRPATLPSALVPDLDPSIDALVLSLLNVADFKARPSAAQALEVLRRVGHGGSTAAQRSEPPVPPTPPETFEDGSIIDEVLRVDASLGSGAFSKVYRVYHLDHQQTYAMKVISPTVEADLMLREYNDIGKNLPDHPNIARVIWMARLSPPDRRPYILSEYVDGETLEPYCKGDKRLSWLDIRRIGAELLDALSAMHPKMAALEAHRAALRAKTSISGDDYEKLGELQHAVDEGIIHRDIKPANILLELPSHRPKLIDFNIATKVIQATGRAGTPRYWAPDRGQPAWLPNMDLFSLGVVLYELVCHEHPFPDDNPEAGEPLDPRQAREDLHLSAELSAFLLKAVSIAGVDRFQTAEEMKAALLAVASMHASADLVSPVKRGAPFAGITLTPDEPDRSNYNPYVTRLLTLYSQASRTNAGTRGLDEIARLTYVKTGLDTKLAPHIADGRFRLVVITGNAGDGKTAFLQQVEQFFANALKADVTRLTSRNGSRWQHGGVSYETNYDGSQDEGNTASDDVLARFFAPFEGESLAGLAGSEARLIAVNEGRLLDFLTHSAYKDRFAGLRAFAHLALDAQGSLPERSLLVNLNLRSIAAGGADALVERQLRELTKSELWMACEDCSHRTRCPLKFNADTMRDEASGPAVISRVRRLFEVVHLRRKAHVTMRDLRSALSWLLLQDHGCDDIDRLITANATSELLDLHYSQALADNGRVGRHGTDDRLVSVLREADPGRVNSPGLDRRLDRRPGDAVPWMTFERRAETPDSVMREATRDVARGVDEVSLPRLLEERRALVERWRRWAYFERRDEGWRDTLPYRSLRQLESVLIARDGGADALRPLAEGIRDNVIEAVSLSEGLRHPGLFSRYLALRMTRMRGASIRSYRLFPKDAFEVHVPSYRALDKYLECAPDALELTARPEYGHATLRISLDLLEMLELIRSGYRPSPADLQGMFVNLLIFRNELMNLPFSRIIVTADEQDLYEISASPDAEVGIRLTLKPYEAARLPSAVAK